MSIQTYDFVIKQGETFSKIINYKDSDGNPIDLGGYTARMQVRKDFNSPLLIELSTDNGRISLNDPTGRIELSIDASDTEDLFFDRAKYDLELVDGDNVNRLLQGVIKLDKEITK